MAIKKKNLTSLIVVMISFILLCSLGIWQLQRLSWKNQVIKEISLKIDAHAIDLPANIDDVQDLKFRLVKVKGTYLHDKEIHLYAGSRTVKGEPGYFILTPLYTNDQRYVIINRGWVPQKLKSASNRMQTLTKGPVEIEGYFFEKEKKTWTTLNNDLNKNVWLWMDLPSMRQHLALPLLDGVIIRKKMDDHELPSGKELLTAHIRNDHLTYVITWFSAAVSLLIIYFIRLRENDRK